MTHEVPHSFPHLPPLIYKKVWQGRTQSSSPNRRKQEPQRRVGVDSRRVSVSVSPVHSPKVSPRRNANATGQQVPSGSPRMMMRKNNERKEKVLLGGAEDESSTISDNSFSTSSYPDTEVVVYYYY